MGCASVASIVPGGAMNTDRRQQARRKTWMPTTEWVAVLASVGALLTVLGKVTADAMSAASAKRRTEAEAHALLMRTRTEAEDAVTQRFGALCAEQQHLIEKLTARVDALEAENGRLRARVLELETENARLKGTQ